MNEQTRRFYEFDNFLVDVEKRQLFRDGEPVTLTPKVFDTLLVFVTNNDRVLEKSELMEHLWADSFVEEANLTQNVSTLRKVLGENRNDHKFLVTVPGRGYRFVAPVRELPDEDTELVVHEKTHTQIILQETETVEQNVALPPPASENISHRTYLFAALALVVISLLGFGAFYLFRSNTKPPLATIDSLAILPFANADSETEYFSEGLTDNLINRFSQLSGIRVTSRNTAFRYKQQNLTSAEIGRKLGVKAVLTGSVTQHGDKVKIQTELIDVANDAQLWGQTFDAPFSEIIKAQDTIAREIAGKLRLRLSGDEQKRLAKHETDNPEAFRLYLKGRYFWNKRTEENIRKSIEYFNEAIALDPDYALAYTGIADAYIILGTGFTTAPTSELLPPAKQAALKALAIDDESAEAHTSLATLKERYEWDFTGAEQEYKRAIELNPEYATAHHRYALFLWMMKRFDEANAEFTRARELDPLSAIIYADSGLPFYSSRQHERAIEYFQKALEIEPDFKLAHFYLARSYAFIGKHEEAIAEANKSFAPDNLFRPDGTKKINGLLPIIYALVGRKNEARAILAELENQPDYILPFNHAAIYAALGEKEQAFSWLNRAYRERASGMVQLKVNPVFDNLRDDPRFADLQRRVGL